MIYYIFAIILTAYILYVAVKRETPETQLAKAVMRNYHTTKQLAEILEKRLQKKGEDIISKSELDYLGFKDIGRRVNRLEKDFNIQLNEIQRVTPEGKTKTIYISKKLK